MDSLVLQTAIGLAFVFASFSVAVSVLTEVISRLIGLRGEYLLRGLRTLLDRTPGRLELAPVFIFRRRHKTPEQIAGIPADAGPLPKPLVTQVMKHALISVSADKAAMPPDAGNAKLTRKERQRLPSYLPARTVASALIGLLADDPAGPITMGKIKEAVGQLDEPLKQALTPLVDAAGTDLEGFRTRLEQWYDDHMARVSGWYKRHVRWVSLAVGAGLVLSFNLSAITIGQSLYTDQALRGSVVTAATEAADCEGQVPAACLRELRKELDSVRSSGLPIGWGPVPECVPHTKCGWLARYGLADPEHGGRFDVMAFLLVIAGWSIMVLALVPGARFWFDSLARLGSLRSTGPKPATS